jgi:glycolate oxidase iron-sulfur subunit
MFPACTDEVAGVLRLAAERRVPVTRAGSGTNIGLQDPCHLRNGLGVWKEPRKLIERVGDYVGLPSTAACCGAGGTCAVLGPNDSARVVDRHLDEIAAADLDEIVAVNPGCYRQLEQGVKRRLRTRVRHIPELLGER